IKTITETYADFFRDLHGWLSEYFFAKLARACFEKSVKAREIMQFFTKETMPGSGTTLKEFLTQAGLREAGALDDVVQAARDVASILEADDEAMDRLQTSMVQAAIKRLVREFKFQGADVVMVVVGMQGRWSTEEIRVRREFVERLARTCGKFSESDVSTRFNIKTKSGSDLPGETFSDKWRRMRDSVRAGIVPV
ncbi:unnamed protein product, partial [Ascophyllum nodosum]